VFFTESVPSLRRPDGPGSLAIAPKTAPKLKRPLAVALLLALTVLLVLATVIIVRKDAAGIVLRRYAGILLHGGSHAGTKSASPDRRLSIEKALAKKLDDFECRQADIRSHYATGDRAIVMQAAVPRGRPFEGMVLALSQAARGTPYIVSDCVIDEKKQSACITFSPTAAPPQAKSSPQVILTVVSSDRYFSGTARMALVVENSEDTSYQLAVSLLSFPEPFSVSIIPGTKKAALIAQIADQHQKEVIIRLAFEPAGKVPAPLEQNTIMVHYSKEAIDAIVSNAVRDIPNFTGFANALGSRACEDSRVMNIVLADIRKQHGYFIETKTTKNSVVAPVATALDCPFSEVNARIEKKTAPDILAELKRLGAQAQSNGTCVASVGATRQLADALGTARPWFRQNGIRLVFVSEIVKHPRE
jgi:polysaccharide deacetylase 2 family uncharacterized protein YibQ